MHAEVHHASASGERGIVEPGLVRPVGVMKDEVRRVDPTEFSGADHVAHPPHPFGEAIGQVHGEEPVRPARGVDGGPHLAFRPPQRFLAEDRGTPFERPDRLLRMHRARRCDHHAVEARAQEAVQSPDLLRAGRQSPALRPPSRATGRRWRRRLRRQSRGSPAGDGVRSIRLPGSRCAGERGHTRLRLVRSLHHQGVTRALRNPSGRSRVASRASPRRSSGKVFVQSGRGSRRPRRRRRPPRACPGCRFRDPARGR